MATHGKRCSAATAFAEHVFQQLEDNKPSDAPLNFSRSSGKKSKPNSKPKSKPKSKPADPGLARNATFGSSDVHARSADGKLPAQHNVPTETGRVKQLIAEYEARGRHVEGLTQEVIRKPPNIASDGHVSSKNQGSVSDNARKLSDGQTGDENDGWVKVVDADLD